jgi:hypothetical protein
MTPNSPTSLGAVIAIAVAGPIWYYVRKAYLKRKGVDGFHQPQRIDVGAKDWLQATDRSAQG